MLPQLQIERLPNDRPDFYPPFHPPGTIVRNILEHLYLRRMTQKTLAVKCGVSPTQVTKWLQQEDDAFTVASLKKIAYALCLDPWKLQLPISDKNWKRCCPEVHFQAEHLRPLWADGLSEEELQTALRARMARHSLLEIVIYGSDEEVTEMAAREGFTELDDHEIRWGSRSRDRRMHEDRVRGRKRFSWHPDELNGDGEIWDDGKNQPRTQPPSIDDEASLPGYYPLRIVDPLEENKHLRPVTIKSKQKMWRRMSEARSNSK